jgi:outer membrane protein OmpA-like peptidoglycan-associated protein
MSGERAFRPNLVAGTPVWTLADDLNDARWMDDALLVPELEGPLAMPTAVTWHVADFVPLHEARKTHPEETRLAEHTFETRAAALRDELAREDSPFARYREAFSLPAPDEADSWFYDPNQRALRVANWGATRRDDGAKSHAVHTTARFAALSREKPSQAVTAPLANPSSTPAPTRGRPSMALVAALVALVVVGGVAIVVARRAHERESSAHVEEGPRPSATTAPSASTPTLARDRDRDGLDDALDECPELPGTRMGCPRGMAGVLVTRDRITTDETVFFSTGSAKLDPSGKTALEHVAKLLVDNPSIEEITVEGHADAVGDADKNFVLSTARALAARRALIELGVPEWRVRVDARGAAERRVASDASVRENRRVELHITKVAPPPL